MKKWLILIILLVNFSYIQFIFTNSIYYTNQSIDIKIKKSSSPINFMLNDDIMGITQYSLFMVSENESFWNNDSSSFPHIAIDKDHNIHVVWEDNTNVWGTDSEIMYSEYIHTLNKWTNPIIISDNSSNWNDGNSLYPDIAVDELGSVYIVWEDWSIGPWSYDQGDSEIMYRKFTPDNGWSDVIIISDNESKWNTGASKHPSIAVDGDGIVSVVWEEYTAGSWGTDSEVFYRRSLDGINWGDFMVISDNSSHWNNGNSNYPFIVADKTGVLHVVWEDGTDGLWGSDSEIFYAFFDKNLEWHDPILVSDNLTNWNSGISMNPKLAVDFNSNVYFVWEDKTAGIWGTDSEIMLRCYYKNNSWSNFQIISDNSSRWNNDTSALPSISIYNNNIFIAWVDYTDGTWGNDTEIMFTWYNRTDWSSVYIISEVPGIINNNTSTQPDIAIDNSGYVYITWRDIINQLGGSDTEIFVIMPIIEENPHIDIDNHGPIILTIFSIISYPVSIIIMLYVQKMSKNRIKINNRIKLKL